MTDKELLLFAAKAYGIDDPFYWESVDNPPFPYAQCVIYCINGEQKIFKPHADDGDALRLAAHLRLNIEYDDEYVTAWNHVVHTDLIHMVAINDDVDAATRRAILIAAAERGKKL